MQAVGGPSAEAILEWLEQEMGYRSPAQYSSVSELALPSANALRKICRGNMISVWKFLLERVKSEKTVENIKRNILVHGSPTYFPSSTRRNSHPTLRDQKKPHLKGTLPSLPVGPTQAEDEETINLPNMNELKEKAIRERKAAEIEVERLAHSLERMRKELKGKKVELIREADERRRVLNDKANSRYKDALLVAYDKKCEQSVRIFQEYQHRLHCFIVDGLDAQKGKLMKTEEASVVASVHDEQSAISATSIKGDSPSEDQIVIENSAERSVRKACESLAAHLIEQISISCSAYNEEGAQNDTNREKVELGSGNQDRDGDSIPEDVKEAALNLLQTPLQLLYAMSSYTSRMVGLIRQETEKIDVRADAEKLRYRFDLSNNRVLEDMSPEMDDNISSQTRSSGGNSLVQVQWAKAASRLLRERQETNCNKKAHVQQFMATEEALNHAAEARKACKDLITSIHSKINGDVESSQNIGALRQFELDVWAKERDVSGLKASVSTLVEEVQRLKAMCDERKAIEESLKQKWRRIEEFSARRMQLESIYTMLVQSNLAAASLWDSHAQTALQHSAATITPLCSMLQEQALSAHDLIQKEVSSFLRSPDNRLYMLPISSQALMESMAVVGAPTLETLAILDKKAEVITTQAAGKDPSAMPTILRVLETFQHASDYTGSDSGLASVVDSLRFCMHSCASPASLLEELAKAMSEVQTLRDLVGSSRSLLDAAIHSTPEFKRIANGCATVALEQEKRALGKWVPELKSCVVEAQRSLEDCRRVRGLVEEWWEQPASTAVDWVPVEGQNVVAWLAHVKQLLSAFYDKQFT